MPLSQLNPVMFIDVQSGAPGSLGLAVVQVVEPEKKLENESVRILTVVPAQIIVARAEVMRQRTPKSVLQHVGAAGQLGLNALNRTIVLKKDNKHKQDTVNTAILVKAPTKKAKLALMAYVHIGAVGEVNIAVEAVADVIDESNYRKF